jgi:hypothetical protein
MTENEALDLGALPKVAAGLFLPPDSYAISIAKRVKSLKPCTVKTKCAVSLIKFIYLSVTAFFINTFTGDRIYVHRLSKATYKLWQEAANNPSGRDDEVISSLLDVKGNRIRPYFYFKRVSIGDCKPENGWIHDFISGWGYWINGVKQSAEIAREHLDEFKNHKKSEVV